MPLFHGWRVVAACFVVAAFGWGLGLFGLGSVAETAVAPPEVVALAEQRIEARARKDFAEADRLRGAVAEHGYQIDDTEGGPRLRRR